MPALMDIITDWENKSKQEVVDARALWNNAYADVPGFRMGSKLILQQVLTGQPIPLPLLTPHARDQLAVRMFNWYLNGTGKDFTLTLADMKAMNTPTKSINGTGSIKTP